MSRILAVVDALVGLVMTNPTTTHSATVEFGLTPAVRYADELAGYTDDELMKYDAVREIERARDAELDRVYAR